MRALQLRIAPAHDWPLGTRLNVFWDAGTGTVDFARPLLMRSVAAFPDMFPARTPGGCYPGRITPGFVAPKAGPRDHILGLDTPADTRRKVLIDVPLPRFQGAAKFAVSVYDEFGNAEAGASPSFNVALSGEPPDAFDPALSAYDATTDTVTVTFSKNTE